MVEVSFRKALRRFRGDKAGRTAGDGGRAITSSGPAPNRLESQAMNTLASVRPAQGETPLFQAGSAVRVSDRVPVGHYRVPTYLRGRRGKVEAVIEPCSLDNEEEGFGRNAGSKRHYYRVAFPMPEIWPGYRGSSRDSLHIEVFESWLEEIAS